MGRLLTRKLLSALAVFSVGAIAAGCTTSATTPKVTTVSCETGKVAVKNNKGQTICVTPRRKKVAVPVKAAPKATRSSKPRAVAY